eukprot:COSAG02_NODE_1624_length_11594_cov_6.314833_4_plen_110_part_00
MCAPHAEALSGAIRQKDLLAEKPKEEDSAKKKRALRLKQLSATAAAEAVVEEVEEVVQDLQSQLAATSAEGGSAEAEKAEPEGPFEGARNQALEYYATHVTPYLAPERR